MFDRLPFCEPCQYRHTVGMLSTDILLQAISCGLMHLWNDLSSSTMNFLEILFQSEIISYILVFVYYSLNPKGTSKMIDSGPNSANLLFHRFLYQL